MKIFGPRGSHSIQPPAMKHINQLSLLALVMEHGPISRTGLAKLSQLSKPTVSAQIETLIHRGLVVETGAGLSGKRGGKKPTQLEFNANYGCLGAVEIDPLEIRLAITDLKGSVIAQTQLETEAREDARSVLERLTQGLRELLQRSGRAERLRQIAVAAPGLVDVRHGVVLQAGNIFNWENVPIADFLSAAFRTPALVDNDLNLAALAEMNYGAAQGVEDFVLVCHHTGIGCGVVMGGQIHRGANWAAGEIAHLLLDLDKAGENWNPRGYLELQVSADRIAERIHQRPALRKAVARFNNGKGDLPALIGACKHGDAAACEVVRDVLVHLAVAIAHVAATYDPPLIVLKGEIFPPFLHDVERIVARIIPWHPRLVESALGKDAALRGAVVAARTKALEAIARALRHDASHTDHTKGAERAVDELPGSWPHIAA